MNIEFERWLKEQECVPLFTKGMILIEAVHDPYKKFKEKYEGIICVKNKMKNES